MSTGATAEASKTSGKRKSLDEFKDLIDSEEYILRKRLPARLPKRKSDVYVSRKTNFKAQLDRCQKILDAENEVFVHGLGHAVNRAVNLALQLKESGCGSVEISTHTSTVTLIDDLDPENDDLEPETSIRYNSSIHIRVYRPDPSQINTLPTVTGSG
ncbi:hypothetical protein SNE40_010129 [Patella caerulea]|uniref:Ribonuclease P protein subunit p20 n=1 Tax=Patella caerulea TaxID=87958 RepID=A0AAN8JVB7_PATCE